MIITWVNQPAMRGGGTPSWSPDSLGEALIGWFDAEDASTLSLTGNLANSITDKRSGLVLLQSNSPQKPVYDGTGFGGRPELFFDGVDDGLLSASQYSYVNGSDPLLLVALVRNTAPSSDSSTVRTAFSCSSASTNCRRIRRSVAAGDNRGQIIVGDGTTSSARNNTYTSLAGLCTLWGDIGAALSYVYVNGVNSDSMSIVPASGAGTVGLGTTTSMNQPWWGGINSVYLINPTHANWTPANQAAFTAFLNQRRGV